MKVKRYIHELDDTKKWYLESMKQNGYDEITIKNHENFLHRIRDFEIKYMNDKKIQKFNYDEIILFLKSLGSSSVDSLTAYSYIINNYLDFCKKESKMDNVIDWMRAINPDILEKCVNKDKFNNRFVTREELYDLVKNLVNYQDKAILLLAFEGIMGKEYSDLINLKVEDLDFENNIIKFKDREIIMNDKLKEILECLVDENTIFLSNKTDNRKYLLNMGSKYLLKPTEKYLALRSTKERIEKGEYDRDKLDPKVLNNRSYIIFKKFLNAPYLTMQNVFKSGAVERVIVKIGKENLTKQNFTEEIMKITDYSLSNCYKIYQNFIDKIED